MACFISASKDGFYNFRIRSVYQFFVWMLRQNTDKTNDHVVYFGSWCESTAHRSKDNIVARIGGGWSHHTHSSQEDPGFLFSWAELQTGSMQCLLGLLRKADRRVSSHREQAWYCSQHFPSMFIKMRFWSTRIVQNQCCVIQELDTPTILAHWKQKDEHLRVILS